MYRFTCSLLFAIALLAYPRQASPVEQLGDLLDWLAIPSAWLSPVGEWVAQRQVVVGAVAVLLLLVAVAFAAANDWHSRSGSTSLLSIVILIQVDHGTWVFTASVIVLAGLALLTGCAGFFARRFGWDTSEWTRPAWEKVGKVLLTLVLAAFYLVSPLGWLISQEPYNVRGTRWNPLYIEQIERRGPSGATAL